LLLAAPGTGHDETAAGLTAGTYRETPHHKRIFNHHLSMVGYLFSSSMSTGCVVLLRRHGAIFHHAGSGQVGTVISPS